jgi:peptidoglycan/xylan/chitin deacetylase (PgdA/CDA1 family)/glycosyltransferase involved in cell wall biosynthesis
VLASLDGGPALPPRPVLVTFDDAYRNNLEFAKPILEELGIPMTLFVPTDFVGHAECYWLEELEWRVSGSPTVAVPWGRELLWLRTPAERRGAFREISEGLMQLGPAERERAWEEIQRQLPCPCSAVPQDVGVSFGGATGVPPVKGHGQVGRATVNNTSTPREPRLTWDELRTLSQEGATIGSHAASHALLPGLPIEKIQHELASSKRELETRLGIRVQAFAYPNGSWDSEVRQMATQEGYECAFTGQPGTNGRDMDRYLLNRIPINATDSFSEFASAVSGFSRLGKEPVPKILQIGNYPPPQCGWAMQTKLLTEGLRRRGAACEVLNINESRKIKSREYVDVQNGADYLFKVVKFTLQGYRPHTHVNAESKKGYILTMAANLTGRALGLPAVMTFHGGLPQSYFPRTDSKFLYWAYRLLFLSAGSLTCDSIEIERAITSYGINGTPIASIPCFSSQNLTFNKQPLPAQIEEFLAKRDPVFFCFVCFRPEYGLETVLAGMHKFAQQHPRAGFIWLGFPAKEVPPAEAFVDAQPGGRPENLLLLGNLDHDTFMTLLSRCFAYFRPHVRDGVSASVLESLAIGVPVVAADNGMRPPGVITYRFEDADDLCAKLEYVVGNYETVKRGLHPQGIEDNIERVAKWLLEEGTRNLKSASRVRPADAPSARPLGETVVN